MGATFTIAPLLLCDERPVESDRPVHAWEKSHANMGATFTIAPLLRCDAWVPRTHLLICIMGATYHFMTLHGCHVRMGAT